MYLDNAATSYPKAPGVIEAVVAALEHPVGNPGRSGGSSSLWADRIVFETRELLARLLGIPDSERIIFAKNATEALNLSLLGSLLPYATVAVSSYEHNAVMRPLRFLERSKAVRVLVYQCDVEGKPLPASFKAALDAHPDLLVATAASNVSGACLPVEEIGAECKARGIRFGIDASQLVGHRALNFVESGASFLCAPGHKGLMGPAGTGFVVLAPDFNPEPLMRGGTGSRSESEEQPEFLPDRHEAGTVNLPGIAGLGAAVRFILETGLDRIEKRESGLVSALHDILDTVDPVRVFGPPRGVSRAPVLSFLIEGMDSRELALELDRLGILVRPGLHCAPLAHRSLGTLSSGGTIRMSPGFFTKETEIEEAGRSIRELVSTQGGRH